MNLSHPVVYFPVVLVVMCCDILKEAFCPVWHTKNDRLRWRPAVCQPGVSVVCDLLGCYSRYLIINAITVKRNLP